MAFNTGGGTPVWRETKRTQAILLLTSRLPCSARMRRTDVAHVATDDSKLGMVFGL